MPPAPTTKTDQDGSDRAAATGLAALAWTLSDDARAERLVALTGLAPADLRARLGEATVLAAVLGFLEAHEPDLLACADALGERPEDLVRARAALDGGAPGR